MTNSSQETKQRSSVVLQDDVMAKAKKKPRQIAHRLAASKPEVQELIKLLRKRWRHAKGEERRARVAALLGLGCSIRGLAEETHIPATTIRYYSDPRQELPEKEIEVATQTSVLLETGPKKMPSPPAEEKRAPALTKELSAGASQIPAGSRKELPKLSIRHLPPKPVPRPPGEIEQPVASLRSRISEIIVGFACANWGIPEIPVSISEIPDLLAGLRTHVGRPWVRPIIVPDRISIKGLLQMTEPDPRIDDLDSSHKSRWLATMLGSLIPNPSEYYQLTQAIDIAERELLPPPEPQDPTVDEFGRKLKPYEMRYRALAKRIAQETSKPG